MIGIVDIYIKVLSEELLSALRFADSGKLHETKCTNKKLLYLQSNLRNIPLGLHLNRD